MHDTDEAMLDDDDDELPENWPLTPVTVAFLVSALDALIGALDTDLETLVDEVNVEPEQSLAIGDFPPMTWCQPQDWWKEIANAADRVRVGLSTDGWYTPLTPAEEAVIYVAIASWVDVAHEVDDKLYERIADLPDLEGYDCDWPEVFPALTGDADIALLWSESLDGIGHPNDETNRMLGIGDYRPHAWHRIFPGRRQGGVA
jgi:hypothetical protein